METKKLLCKKFPNCKIDDLTRTSSHLSKCKTLPLLQPSPIPMMFTPRNSIEQPYDLFDDCIKESEEFCEQEMLEQLSVLQTLHKKERELKTAIHFKKLKKEEPRIKDKSALKEKIAELEKTLDERKKDFKMKDIVYTKRQLMEVLQNIAVPCRDKQKSESKEVYEYSDEQRGLLLGLLLRRKQINKDISLQQQEIEKIEDSCVEMKASIDKAVNESTNTEMVIEEICSASNVDELKRLETENIKRSSHVQLLAKITKSLIENIDPECNLKDDIKTLAASCGKILHWNYEDLDGIHELCKSVYSTHIE